MVMVPKELAVLMRLTELLERIAPTNIDPATTLPFTNDLTGKVFRGRTVIGAQETRPYFGLLEDPKPVDGQPAGPDGVKRLVKKGLLLQGFSQDDPVNPLDPAYFLKAQAEQMLSRIIAVKQSNGNPAFPEDHMLGGLLTSFTIGTGVVRPSDPNVSPTAFFYMPLVVGMVTDATQPYVAVG